MTRSFLTGILLSILVIGSCVADSPVAVGVKDYVVKVENPYYKNKQGPRVLVDEAHFNYQTTEDRFMGFAQLLKADGAQVSPSKEKLTADVLSKADILVICNALNEKNYKEKQTENKWKTPAPSAFSADEIKAVNEWVKAGGALLLISDHMPFPDAAKNLANSFGIVLQSNFAFDAAFTYKPGDMNLMTFYQKPPKASVGSLGNHAVTKGIDYIVTFTGSAFRMKPNVDYTPILTLGDGSNTAWPMDHVDITPATPFAAGAGLLQGAVMNYGKGRVAMFGEASMFSVNYAEWANNYPTGFHNPDAPFNQPFILNLTHWLAGK